jgi:hypothetical protein
MIGVAQIGMPGGSELLVTLLWRTVVYGLPVVAAIWVYHDAKTHDRRAIPWTLGTLLLGPFAVLTLVFYVVTRHPDDEVFDPLGRYDE